MLFEFRTDFEPVNIQIQLFVEDNRYLYSITSINGEPLGTPVQRTRCPIAPITLPEGYARDVAKIPDGAKYSCWLNGSPFNENDPNNAEPNEAAMLLLGGLAYLDGNDESGNSHVIQINRFKHFGTGRLQFSGSKTWSSEYTQTLIDQNRFAVGINYNIPFSTPLFCFYSYSVLVTRRLLSEVCVIMPL
jgi:hypothetical protein